MSLKSMPGGTSGSARRADTEIPQGGTKEPQRSASEGIWGRGDSDISYLRGVTLMDTVAMFIREEQKRRGDTTDADAGASSSRLATNGGGATSAVGGMGHPKDKVPSRKSKRLPQTRGNFDAQVLADNLNELLRTGQVEAKSRHDDGPGSSLTQAHPGLQAANADKKRGKKLRKTATKPEARNGACTEAHSGGTGNNLSMTHSTAQLPPCSSFLGLRPAISSKGEGRTVKPGPRDASEHGPVPEQGSSPERVNRTAAMMSRFRSPLTSPLQTRKEQGTRSPSPYKGRFRGWFTPTSTQATPNLTPERSPREPARQPLSTGQMAADSTALPCRRPKSPLAGAMQRLKQRVQEMQILGPGRPGDRSPSPYQQRLYTGRTETARQGHYDCKTNFHGTIPRDRVLKTPEARSHTPPKFATAEQIIAALHSKLGIQAASEVTSQHEAANVDQNPVDKYGSKNRDFSRPTSCSRAIVDVEAPETSPEPVLPESLLKIFKDKENDKTRPVNMGALQSPDFAGPATSCVPMMPLLAPELSVEVRDPATIKNDAIEVFSNFSPSSNKKDSFVEDPEASNTSSLRSLGLFPEHEAQDRSNSLSETIDSPALQQNGETADSSTTMCGVTSNLPLSTTSQNNNLNGEHQLSFGSLHSSMCNSRSDSPVPRRPRPKVVRSPGLSLSRSPSETVDDEVQSMCLRMSISKTSKTSKCESERGADHIRISKDSVERQCQSERGADFLHHANCSEDVFGLPLPPPGHYSSGGIIQEAKNSFLRLIAMVAPGVSSKGDEALHVEAKADQDLSDDLCTCTDSSPRVSVEIQQQQDQALQPPACKTKAPNTRLSLLQATVVVDADLTQHEPENAPLPAADKTQDIYQMTFSEALQTNVASLRYESARESLSDLMARSGFSYQKEVSSVVLSPMLQFAAVDECQLLMGMGRSAASFTFRDSSDIGCAHNSWPRIIGCVDNLPRGMGTSCIGTQQGKARTRAARSINVSLAGLGADLLRAAGWWNAWAGTSTVILDPDLELGRVLLFGAAMVTVHHGPCRSRGPRHAQQTWTAILLRLPHLLLAPSMALIIHNGAINAALAEWQRLVRCKAAQGSHKLCSPKSSKWELQSSIQSDTALARFPVLSTVNPEGYPASPVMLSRRQQRKEQGASAESPRPVVVTRGDLVAAAEAQLRAEAGLTAPQPSSRSFIPSIMQSNSSNSSSTKSPRTPRDILRGMTKALRKGAGNHREKANSYRAIHAQRNAAGTLGQMAQMAMEMDQQKAQLVFNNTHGASGAHSTGPNAPPCHHTSNSNQTATPGGGWEALTLPGGATYRPVPLVVMPNTRSLQADLVVQVTTISPTKQGAGHL